jgi:acetate kinase
VEVVASTIDALLAKGPVDAVGYRVVHGGERFTGPVLIDDRAIEAIEALGDLAPLHNPLAASTIRAATARLPGIPHVAAFDTAFHATLPEVAVCYPVPGSWRTDAGVRRYGFHGLSVTWSVRRAAELLDRPADELALVVAHLGGGCSVTAVDRGRSVDTSMGMTPLEGLMMGTRAGSIDPGIIFRLLRTGLTADAIEADLDRRSGLVAVGGTADMARLLDREARGDDAAVLAVEMFVRRTAAGIAAATTHLTTVDGVVFTGGIGEHAQSVTTRISRRLHLAGALGAESRVDGDEIARSVGGPAILRIAAREDLVIADSVAATLGGG